MLWLIPILAALCAASFRWILGCPRFLPPAEGSGGGSVSVVIPARDEEGNIGDLLDSIRKQRVQPREVIVVDDDSTDRTALIARDKGAKVVTSGPLPEGWKGKPWACRQGARAAMGDWLLFVDADVRFEGDAMGRIVALAGRPGVAHSVCPYHRICRPYEELSAFFNVLMIAGINAFGAGGGGSRGEALFGQCLLISTEDYRQVGGHEPVRSEVLEHFQLANHLRKCGITRKCYLGRGHITMRMFPGGLRELVESWRKGCASGAGSVAPRALAWSSLWITGGMLALIGVLLGGLPEGSTEFRIVVAGVYLLYAWQCWRAFRLAGSFSMFNALIFPVALLFYQSLFFASVIGRRSGIKTRWKNRDVD